MDKSLSEDNVIHIKYTLVIGLEPNNTEEQKEICTLRTVNLVQRRFVRGLIVWRNLRVCLVEDDVQ